MKSVIVDDERIARQELRRLLAAHPEIEILGEAQNGEQALDLIPKLAPDVIFLDIQMPEMTGFSRCSPVWTMFRKSVSPTAYDEYAIKAFDSERARLSFEADRPRTARRRRRETASAQDPSAPRTGFCPRWRTLLARTCRRYLPAGIGGQLHPRLLRSTSAH